MLDDVSDSDRRDMLRETFERQAESRREKAAQHPTDERNAEAAELLDKLAATVSDIPADVLSAYYADWNDDDSEAESEMMRYVGFHTEPSTAEEFARSFVEARRHEGANSYQSE
jgi:hypothetical protein